MCGEIVDPFTVPGELVDGAGTELREALGNMVKPPAELVAGSQLPRPLVKRSALLGYTARPDVVD